MDELDLHVHVHVHEPSRVESSLGQVVVWLADVQADYCMPSGMKEGENASGRARERKYAATITTHVKSLTSDIPLFIVFSLSISFV